MTFSLFSLFLCHLPSTRISSQTSKVSAYYHLLLLLTTVQQIRFLLVCLPMQWQSSNVCHQPTKRTQKTEKREQISVVDGSVVSFAFHLSASAVQQLCSQLANVEFTIFNKNEFHFIWSMRATFFTIATIHKWERKRERERAKVSVRFNTFSFLFRNDWAIVRWGNLHFFPQFSFRSVVAIVVVGCVCVGDKCYRSTCDGRERGAASTKVLSSSFFNVISSTTRISIALPMKQPPSPPTFPNKRNLM